MQLPCTALWLLAERRLLQACHQHSDCTFTSSLLLLPPVFDEELALVQERARQMAAAGVDAVIVQVRAGCALIRSVASFCCKLPRMAEANQLRQLHVRALRC